MSDKYLTERCGVLDHLPSDAVLADRGFDISDSSHDAGPPVHSCLLPRERTNYPQWKFTKQKQLLTLEYMLNVSLEV